MATLTIRDPYGNEFEIDATARKFWEHREGYTILPEPAPSQQDESPAQSPDKTGAPKSTQRAARAAQDVKEQPGG
ncbi:hypothetical protein FH608_046070 [Nonomuraea phyllanthi]|uniref:Uncharacterized protein n=2 Tax=Nonomuraea phyllanthi TaxID=2219224 RepID=A0A8E0T5U8_9ACTN|nr:hypothetical protein FH608_046070 [Nonomuraea phyllanthi]